MIPVILSGGSGTRLWPVSRASFPKQFVEIFDASLMEKTYRRLMPLGSPWTVTVRDLEILTKRTMKELGIPGKQALFEPFGRNTAAAIALLCRVLEQQGLGEEIVGIFSADHLIQNEETFHQAVRLAADCAAKGQVVTLGLKPSFAATGYGYIEVDTKVFATGAGGLQAHVTKGFREKPDEAAAQKFVATGNYFWNAGMFIFRVSVMAQHLQSFVPEVYREMAELKSDLSNLGVIYERVPSVSIDYGVMEKLKEQVCVPCDLGWSDVGSWDEVARLRAQNPHVIEEKANANFVFGTGEKSYAFVGVDNLIVADTPDALLVAKKGETQRVKEVVDRVKAAGSKVATEHPFEYRPWGSFEILRDTAHFKSKVIYVEPGQQLSYQSHDKRAEHWIIIRGAPEVVLNDVVHRPKPGEAIFIPRQAKHRIRNPGVEVVEFVEVQVGQYFGEDDIVRYSDDYGRG